MPEINLIERLNGRIDAWKHNSDKARVSVPLGELRALRARLAASEAETARLREALTPSGDTKAAYSGEFYERIEIGNPNFEDDEDEPETIMQPVMVSWTTIKEIMAAIASRAALANGGKDEA